MSNSALNEYLEESFETVKRVRLEFVAFVLDMKSHDKLNSVYRDVHTLKGTAQLYGFNNIGYLSHALETQFDAIRSGKFTLDNASIDLIHIALNFLEDLLRQIQQQGNDHTDDIKSIIGRVIDQGVGNLGVTIAQSKREAIDLSFQSEDVISLSQTISEPLSKDVIMKANEEKLLQSTSPVSSVEPDLNKVTTGDSTVRVYVKTLDRLMNLVGEIVLVRNQVLQYTSNRDDVQLNAMGQNLNVVTSDLQEEVMKTRMQPIGNVLNKFQRVVRDIARDLGKEIEIEIVGAETELDRTLLEAINDPLTHIIRNACDHGIEPASEREEKGKSRQGKVTVRAFHEGGQIVIEISDDGRGIDRDKVLKKAIEKNLATVQSSSKLGDKDIFAFIFAPGFSTADKVSAVSGRGVGVDVVKTNIERIGGAVELHSNPGRGSQISLKIPLTLAIVPALTIKSDSQTFAIPQVKLEELVRVETYSTAGGQIEFLHGKPVFRLRGNLLSLIGLNQIINDAAFDAHMVKSKPEINIVVLSADGLTFGLVVDQILDSADIVVKPVSTFLKSIPIYSGATILGDGSVALILDVSGIAKFSRMHSGQSVQSESSGSVVTDLQTDLTDYVIAQMNQKTKVAIPMCLVNRLEEFPRSKIEWTGNAEVIQYRDNILPLVNIGKFFVDKPLQSQQQLSDSVSVVVVLYKGVTYGLVIDKVIDVVSSGDEIKPPVKVADGVMGNIIFQNEVLTVLDVHKMLDIEFDLKTVVSPMTTTRSVNKSEAKRTILLVEDTSFFRKNIKKILEEDGFNVVEAVDGNQGFEMFQKQKESIFLVLSDIEMPNCTGLQMAEMIRSTGNTTIPLIAITTKFSKRDSDLGIKAGFNKYLGKLNKEELINTIESYLGVA